MPLSAQINPVQPRDKETTLEKIAAAVGIANSVLGTALAIPKFMQERKQSKAEIAKTEAETLGLGAKAAETKDLGSPISVEEQNYYRGQGVPDSMIPKTKGEAKDLFKSVFETPATRNERENRQALLGLATSENRRKQETFTREMSKPILTPAEEATDKKFAETYTEFLSGGGFADARKGIDQLKSVQKTLGAAEKEGKDYTGKAIGITPRAALAYTNPEAAAMRDSVEEVVQRNLRLVLGAQFTQQEGERLISRAYNPALSEQENQRRIDRLVKQMEAAYKIKIDAANWYEKNGTLKGWKGTLVTSPDQFLQDEKDPDIEAYAQKYGLSYEKAQQIIDSRMKKHGR